MKKLLVATRNPGKLREFNAFFASWGYLVLGLNAFPELPPVAEDGKTFEENARKKAAVLFTHMQLPVLADDSGLEVDALGGRPGVFSARYAGEAASDEENNRKLLQELARVPDKERGARFRSVLVLQLTPTQVVKASGAIEGVILREPRGTGGFGYDPLFFLPEQGVTMAELSPVEKNRLSHRAKALEGLQYMCRHIG